MTTRLGLDGRCALITDGTSEIGRACVRRLRDEGMAIAFIGSERERGAAIARETGALFLECDLRDRSGCDRALERALEFGDGRLDVLVTHAATVFEGSIEATPEAAFRDLLEVDLTALFRVTRACFATMRARGRGSMIHVASDAGIRAAHETAAHSVVSAGLIALAELFAAEGASDGVRSNAVCPGATAAPSLAIGTDVAAVVAWLACDQAAHVSGATVRVDGGSGAAMVQNTRT